MRRNAQYQNAYSRSNSIHSYQKHEKTYWGHVHDELPERLLSRLCEHIPYRVIDRCKSEMNDTLLRADPYIRTRLALSARSHADCGCLPAQLGVTGHPVPGLAHVHKKLLGIAAYQALGEYLDSMADLFIRINHRLSPLHDKKREREATGQLVTRSLSLKCSSPRQCTSIPRSRRGSERDSRTSGILLLTSDKREHASSHPIKGSGSMTHDISSPADGERHSMTHQIVIGVQRHICRGVIAICIPMTQRHQDFGLHSSAECRDCHQQGHARMTYIASVPSPVTDVGKRTSTPNS